MNSRCLLIPILFALCSGSLHARDDKKDPPVPKAPTDEQIKAWLKKIEEPTRATSDPKQGPPEGGVGPDFEFRIHGEAILLARAGEAARPGVFALLENTKKSGQARAHAAIVLLEWLRGKGAKQELDKKVLQALRGSLKDKDQALKWGILHWSQRYGKAKNQADFTEERFRDLFQSEQHTTYFSDAAMDGLLPEIIALVADEEPMIASTAAYTVACFGRPKQGVKELLAALDRREASVRTPVLVALSRVGVDDPIVLKAVLGQLKPEYYAGGYYEFVVRAVGRFGPKAKEAVPALIEVIKSSEFKRHARTELYRAAFDSLGEIGPDAKDAVPALLKYADAVSAYSVIPALDKIDPEAAKQARVIAKRQMDEISPQKKP